MAQRKRMSGERCEKWRGGESMERRLWEACHGGDEREALRLLALGADPRWANHSGISCAMIAIDSNVGGAALDAVAQGSDLAASDLDGDTAIHRAARMARAELAGWIAARPELADLLDGESRLPSRDAAFARAATSLRALLAAESDPGGSAPRCLGSALARGCEAGDEADCAKAMGMDARLGAARSPAPRELLKGMRSGEKGRAMRRDKRAAERAELEACFEALWPWMDAEKWSEAVEQAQPGRPALAKSVERAKEMASLFWAKKEAGEIAGALGAVAPGDLGGAVRL